MVVPVVDQDVCIGCGLCTQVAPKTFALNDDQVSTVINPQGDEEAAIQQAIDGCPVSCISWGEAEA
jgi:ferredoxin